MPWSRRTVLRRLGHVGLAASPILGFQLVGLPRTATAERARRSFDRHEAAASPESPDETCWVGNLTGGELYNSGTRVEAGGIAVVLQPIDETAKADKSLTIRVETKDGEPLTNALVFVTVQMPSMDHGISAYPAREVGDGHYRAEDLSLGMPGEWVVMVGVIRQARVPISAPYRLEIE